MKAWTFANSPRLGAVKRLQAGVLLVVFTMVIVLLSPVFGLSHAKAAVNEQIAIKNVSLVKVSGQDGEEELPGKGMQLWEYANLKFDWDATGVNPNLSSGDQFTISLPEELVYVASVGVKLL